MNPCGMNPCSGGNTDIRGNKFKSFQEAVAMGEKMWKDESLGTSGLACLSCHGGYEMLNLDKRQNYPHYVEMTGDVVSLDQMVNYCMLNPMKGETFEWNSREMTAMTAYFRAYRMKFLSEHK
jgi:cytochrome c